MGALYGFLIFIEVIVSALLIVVIFMQKTKGGMGGSAFGGGAGEAIFGSRMGNVLTKATVVLGVIFLVNTILLTILTSRRGVTGSVMEGAVQQRAAQQQPASMPSEGDASGWVESEMFPGADATMRSDIPVTRSQDAGDDEVLVVAPAPVEADVIETGSEAGDEADMAADTGDSAADLGE